MEKFDFKKKYAPLWKASSTVPAFIDVPGLPYIMIDGKGDPNSEIFQEAMQALYGIAYTTKFSLKKVNKDFGVAPLEGLWWANNLEDFTLGKKENWLWTVMIMMPPFVTAQHINKAKEDLKEKKDVKAADKIRFEIFDEGKCAQIMHIGPYANEEPTILSLFKFIKDNGKQLRGKHHEIYIGDPRKSAPEKLKTIIRHPVV